MVTTAAFLAFMLVGVPIGVCLCLGSIVYIFASGNPLLFQSFPTQLFGGVDNYGLISIPLFVLIGEIMNGGGITRRIIDMTMAFVGAMRGGACLCQPARQHVRRLDTRLGHGAGCRHGADDGAGDGEEGL